LMVDRLPALVCAGRSVARVDWNVSDYSET
jgi:hypothetical protein